MRGRVVVVGRELGLLVRERASLPASVKERDWGEIGGSSGNIVMPWEASSLIASSWGVLGVEQREDNSESVMEEMRGMEEMDSEVMSPVTHMVSEKVVAVNLLGWPDRGVKYWQEVSSDPMPMPSPTLLRAIWMGSRLIWSGRPSVSRFSSSDFINCKLF